MIRARRHSKRIMVGNVPIGGGAPIAIQSMTTTKTDDIQATLIQAHALATQGADIVRVAVPHPGDAAALPVIVREAGVPIVADIHFSFRLAIMALEAGVAGLRLNPGNIRDADQIRTIVREAAGRGVPIRVGVNAGSLDKRLLAKYGGGTPQALVESALHEIKILEDEGFTDIKISVKHQNVPQMIDAYRLLAEAVEYPLHLGVTEAGPPPYGTLKSAIGIGSLLSEGIGDTIRVSLTADPVEEVKVAKQILQTLGLRRTTFDLVACPSCGRAEMDVIDLTRQVQERLEKMNLPPIQIAVMGCEVNGPGEARDADVGIAAGPGRGLLFSRGRQIGWVPADRMVDALLEEAVKVATENAAIDKEAARLADAGESGIDEPATVPAGAPEAQRG
ncbi:MAG TPA: flavodoxin-dependent (E)-4-hydroxy-3-methylbut-2-enyl-diphosphate synthase [Actinomycetota bacterium]|nr:flavodoxin-dependent (E)-4-hydroxy-3-methylbut-2-enyl-diphosphate synthase [Actinomycetota bacterium]